MKILKIGTRKSKLSKIQTRIVIDKILRVYDNLKIEIIEITTRGDIDLKKPIYKIPGSGVFVEELNKALIQNKIDIAVHSLKDYPTEHPDTIQIASIPVRDPPYDAIVPGSYGFDALKNKITIGTSSLRRIAHLKYVNKDLNIVNVRGNIDTRLAKIGVEADLIVLAEAGLIRIGYRDYYRLSPEILTPQAGQGAIAVVARKDSFAEKIARAINDSKAYYETHIERKILKILEGGCKTPLGVFTKLDTSRGVVETYVSIISRDFDSRIFTVDRSPFNKNTDQLVEKVIKMLEKENIYGVIKEWRSHEIGGEI